MLDPLEPLKTISEPELPLMILEAPTAVRALLFLFIIGSATVYLPSNSLKTEVSALVLGFAWKTTFLKIYSR